MHKFTLQPCRLREEFFVPTKDLPVELDWAQLCKELAPSRQLQALRTLQLLQINSFVGLTQSSPGVCYNFVLTNLDRSGAIGHLLKRDPTFASRLVKVYRVESAIWDSKTVELPGVYQGSPK